ncbi:MAG TPA: hypothetical protein VF653_08145 [Methylomirabilota bacterium]
MSEWPHHGAFPHQHGDTRRLMERIEAQLRERIEEALEMAALKLMVEARARSGRPAPDSTSTTDRAEFQTITAGMLARLRERFAAELPEEQRARLAEVEAAMPDASGRPLAGQVFLARQLPDYWQRLERYQREDSERYLVEARRPGWLKRLFGAP